MSTISWIKIETSSFDNNKIRLINKMPQGDMILCTWFRLLIEAGKSNDNGYVYIDRDIPYTCEMLGRLFDRSVKKIKMALEILRDFKLIDIDDNDFIKIINWDKHQNVEKMNLIKEAEDEKLNRIRMQGRERAARYRERKRMNRKNGLRDELDKYCEEKNKSINKSLLLDEEECSKEVSIYNEEIAEDNQAVLRNNQEILNDNEIDLDNNQAVSENSEMIFEDNLASLENGEADLGNNQVILESDEKVLGNNKVVSENSEMALDDNKVILENAEKVLGNNEVISENNKVILDNYDLSINKTDIENDQRSDIGNKNSVIKNESNVMVTESNVTVTDKNKIRNRIRDREDKDTNTEKDTGVSVSNVKKSDMVTESNALSFKSDSNVINNKSYENSVNADNDNKSMSNKQGDDSVESTSIDNNVSSNNEDEDSLKNSSVDNNKDTAISKLDKSYGKKNYCKLTEKEEEAVSILRNYENVSGRCGWIDYSVVKLLLKDYEKKYVEMAFDRAVNAKKFKMNYICGILRNWKNYGYPKEGEDFFNGRGNKLGFGADKEKFKGIKKECRSGLTRNEWTELEKELI